jgi:CubicO group peptidase (beta-lactamase class C family)
MNLKTISLLAISTLAAAAANLPRSAPEAHGVSSAGLLHFVQSLDENIDGMHSIMVVRHGQVIAEGWWTPYNAQSQHTMFSLSKSFTSTAVGMAVAEGKLSIDDTLLSIFPDDAPAEPSANLKNMRIRDLLQMSTGHHDPDIARFNYSPESGSAAKGFLTLPVAHKPGTHFVYNTPASFMLSASVQKRTGQSVLEYLKPRLFEPLGIETPIWETNNAGINLGGFGLHIRTEDIAKFGQLYLQKGEWNGKQLIPKAWVAAATTRQTSNGSNPKSDWDQGYCYQFWRCQNNAFRGDGAFGQYCVVMPDQDSVVAITSGVKDMQAVLNVVWDTLLPELKSATLPPNRNNETALQSKLGSLTLRPIPGTAVGTTTKKKFVFPVNAQKVEEAVFDDSSITLRCDGVSYRLPYAPSKWAKTKFAYANQSEQPVGVSSAWNENRLTLKIAFYETPFVLTLNAKTNGDELTLDHEFNVGFGNSKLPQLTGRAE